MSPFRTGWAILLIRQEENSGESGEGDGRSDD